MSPIIYVVIFVISPAVIILILRMYCRLTVGKYLGQQCMSGKTVLITGASAGIGKATALDLARRNARVLLACRNLEKAEKVKSEIVTSTGNTNVDIKHLDLESFDSVRKCAEDVLQTERRLDVLINNAGMADCALKMTKDGCEMVMQTNHLGHFLLTLLLLDLLKKTRPSRIINVSSITYFAAVLDMDDMEGTKHNCFMRNIGNYYYRSKLANIWFTTELARRLEGTGVTVNCLHPGLIKTDIFFNTEHPALNIYRFFMYVLGKSPEEGAQTTIYLAVDPDVENVTGKFFYGCAEGRLLGKALSKRKAGEFFELSEKKCGNVKPNMLSEVYDI